MSMDVHVFTRLCEEHPYDTVPFLLGSFRLKYDERMYDIIFHYKLGFVTNHGTILKSIVRSRIRRQQT